MGSGHNTNGPDRSDEYEDRRPPEEERTDAQQTVRDAVKAAREATEEGAGQTDDADSSGRSPSLTDLSGVGSVKASALREAGFETVKDVRDATAEELTRVSGVGERLAGQLREAATAATAESADTRPAVSSEVDVAEVSERLGIDFSGVEEVEKRGQTYLRLDDDQREQLLDALRERHGEDALDSVFERTSRWKTSSAPAEPTQGLELTAKAALGITAEVRTSDDDEIHAADPSDAEIGVYRDLHDASRAFLHQHLGDEFRVHRAVRKRSVAVLTAQSLDKPTASDYYFPTSVLSNHTTVGEVTSGFNDGITVSWDAQPNDVAVAVDQLRPHDRTLEESELHVKGGIIRVEADGVIHSLLNEGGERPLSQTATLVENPEQMNPEQHRDVADLVEMMMDQDVRVRSEAGADRVTRWFEECETRAGFSEAKLNALRASVEFVTIIDDRDWSL